VGRYVPSPKNNLVSGLYERLGFTGIPAPEGTFAWRRPVESDTRDLVTYIEAHHDTQR